MYRPEEMPIGNAAVAIAVNLDVRKHKKLRHANDVQGQISRLPPEFSGLRNRCVDSEGDEAIDRTASREDQGDLVRMASGANILCRLRL